MSSRCADKPCPTCPWRKSSAKGGGEIPNFSIELMRNLANTAAPHGSDVTWPRNVFACHSSKQGSEYACAGYVAQEGGTNVNLMLGIDVDQIKDNCSGIDLYENFHVMLADYELALGNEAPVKPSLAERLTLVLDECLPGDDRWNRLEEETGIPGDDWKAAYNHELEPTAEMVDAIMQLWAGHGAWLKSGGTHMDYIRGLNK